ncbi:hypothetical protein HMN09_00012600 [Mycena chlorophos]|uniref:DUF6534 domain-containing protein n=1 Tax=Mycena chlorophos TaxID=658473 RepID=A0A8H6WKT9_MYCCL|nr:hypothetical protein HMN09_00012600 [Mycena chlorophos]
MVVRRLFGVMSMQTFHYFQVFGSDRAWIKCLVGSLWILDTLQLALMGHTLYYWLITNYANPEVLTEAPWSLASTVLTTNTIVFIVQCFLARRVWILSNHNLGLTLLIVVLSLTYYAFALDGQVQLFQLKEDIALFYKFRTITSLGLACASAADIIIGVSLSVYLHHSRTGLVSTNSLIMTLILYSINTGLLTAIVVAVDMICFLTMPTNLIHFAINIVSGKLYTNSLLATLNYRQHFRRPSNAIHTLGTTPAISLSLVNNPPLPSTVEFSQGPSNAAGSRTPPEYDHDHDVEDQVKVKEVPSMIYPV